MALPGRVQSPDIKGEMNATGCFWCLKSVDETKNYLTEYSSEPLDCKLNKASNSLKECIDCIRMYHQGRAAMLSSYPDFEKILFPVEVNRLLSILRSLIQETKSCLNNASQDDEDENANFGIWGNSQGDEYPLPITVHEILRFPFYLQDKDVDNEFCNLMKVLQRSEQLQVSAIDALHCGLFLLLIHPNCLISKWAHETINIHVSEVDSCEDFSHVVSLMLSVFSFGLFGDRSFFDESAPSTRRILSSHLFPEQELPYWQGLCCLFQWISKESLNSLGSELHKEITTMYYSALESNDDQQLFWPKLEGFHQVMDKLEFRIWQYLTKAADEVFLTIFNHPCIVEAVQHPKIQETDLNNQLMKRADESAPFTWLRAFMSTLLESDAITEDFVTMVLEAIVSKIPEGLTNSTNSAEPSVFLSHSVLTLIEILECLLSVNFLGISLPCFKKCFNIITLFQTQFPLEHDSFPEMENFQAYPLTFIRNLLNLCVTNEICLMESKNLLLNIDNFRGIDLSVMYTCIESLVKQLQKGENVSTLKDPGTVIFNEKYEPSTSGTLEHSDDGSDNNSDVCDQRCMPFVTVKEEPLDQLMFEDSSVANTFEQYIWISSDSDDDDAPEVPKSLADKKDQDPQEHFSGDSVIVKKEDQSSDGFCDCNFSGDSVIVKKEEQSSDGFCDCDFSGDSVIVKKEEQSSDGFCDVNRNVKVLVRDLKYDIDQFTSEPSATYVITSQNNDTQVIRPLSEGVEEKSDEYFALAEQNTLGYLSDAEDDSTLQDHNSATVSPYFECETQAYDDMEYIDEGFSHADQPTLQCTDESINEAIRSQSSTYDLPSILYNTTKANHDGGRETQPYVENPLQHTRLHQDTIPTDHDGEREMQLYVGNTSQHTSLHQDNIATNHNVEREMQLYVGNTSQHTSLHQDNIATNHNVEREMQPYVGNTSQYTSLHQNNIATDHNVEKEMQPYVGNASQHTSLHQDNMATNHNVEREMQLYVGNTSQHTSLHQDNIATDHNVEREMQLYVGNTSQHTSLHQDNIATNYNVEREMQLYVGNTSQHTKLQKDIEKKHDDRRKTQPHVENTSQHTKLQKDTIEMEQDSGRNTQPCFRNSSQHAIPPKDTVATKLDGGRKTQPCFRNSSQHAIPPKDTVATKLDGGRKTRLYVGNTSQHARPQQNTNRNLAKVIYNEISYSKNKINNKMLRNIISKKCNKEPQIPKTANSKRKCSTDESDTAYDSLAYDPGHTTEPVRKYTPEKIQQIKNESYEKINKLMNRPKKIFHTIGSGSDNEKDAKKNMTVDGTSSSQNSSSQLKAEENISQLSRQLRKRSFQTIHSGSDDESASDVEKIMTNEGISLQNSSSSLSHQQQPVILTISSTSSDEERLTNLSSSDSDAKFKSLKGFSGYSLPEKRRKIWSESSSSNSNNELLTSNTKSPKPVISNNNFKVKGTVSMKDSYEIIEISSCSSDETPQTETTSDSNERFLSFSMDNSKNMSISKPKKINLSSSMQKEEGPRVRENVDSCSSSSDLEAGLNIPMRHKVNCADGISKSCHSRGLVTEQIEKENRNVFNLMQKNINSLKTSTAPLPSVETSDTLSTVSTINKVTYEKDKDKLSGSRSCDERGDLITTEISGSDSDFFEAVSKSSATGLMPKMSNDTKSSNDLILKHDNTQSKKNSNVQELSHLKNLDRFKSRTAVFAHELQESNSKKDSNLKHQRISEAAKSDKGEIGKSCPVSSASQRDRRPSGSRVTAEQQQNGRSCERTYERTSLVHAATANRSQVSRFSERVAITSRQKDGSTEDGSSTDEVTSSPSYIGSFIHQEKTDVSLEHSSASVAYHDDGKCKVTDRTLKTKKSLTNSTKYKDDRTSRRQSDKRPSGRSSENVASNQQVGGSSSAVSSVSCQQFSKAPRAGDRTSMSVDTSVIYRHQSTEKRPYGRSSVNITSNQQVGGSSSAVSSASHEKFSTAPRAGCLKVTTKQINLECHYRNVCDRLVSIILSWKPEWLETPEESRCNEIVQQLGKRMTLTHGPETFTSINYYIEVFVPLLLLETWSNIAKDYQENENNTNILKVKCTRCSARMLSCQQFVIRNKTQISLEVKDLVLLSVGPRTKKCCVFGIITEKIEKKNQRLGELNYTISVPKDLSEYISCNKNIEIKCVTSMISHYRLFSCFNDLHKLLLARDILCPRVRTKMQKITGPDPSSLITKLNADQAKAADQIFACMEQPFGIPYICLLHGPPGTGKTRTIINIIERILKKWRAGDVEPPLPGQTRMVDSRPKILVCAPSNTAVDRLVLNVAEICLKQCRDAKSMHDPRFNCGFFNIVRVGGNVHPRCMRYQLANIVDKQVEKAKKRANTTGAAKQISLEIANCEKELKKTELNCVKLKMNPITAYSFEFDHAERTRDRLHQALKSLKKKKEETKVRINVNERRNTILKQADVVFCTLNGSGCADLDFLSKTNQAHFQCVIVDEACQCSELETLIPLKFKSSKLLLVGDPYQLPATVMSEEARSHGYQCSLFERIYRYYRKNKIDCVHMLRTQYRMHPEICKFPSQHFYGNHLKSFKSVAVHYEEFPFQPYLVFDVIEGREQVNGKSMYNEAESEMVEALLKRFVTLERIRIGVITPYKEQKELIQRKVERLADTDKDIKTKIEISTVDGFQGQEKDIIILSCVRAKDRGNNIGFVADRNRMNVALTRAKMALYVVGHLKTLQRNQDWNALIQNADNRKLVHLVKHNYESAAGLCKKMKENYVTESQCRNRSTVMKISTSVGGGRSGNLTEKKNQPAIKTVGLNQTRRHKNVRSVTTVNEKTIEETPSTSKAAQIKDVLYSKRNTTNHSKTLNDNRLKNTTEAIRSKHPHGPRIKTIEGLPPNPRERRRSGNVGQNKRRNVTENEARKRHKSAEVGNAIKGVQSGVDIVNRGQQIYQRTTDTFDPIYRLQPLHKGKRVAHKQPESTQMSSDPINGSSSQRMGQVSVTTEQTTRTFFNEAPVNEERGNITRTSSRPTLISPSMSRYHSNKRVSFSNDPEIREF